MKKQKSKQNECKERSLRFRLIFQHSRKEGTKAAWLHTRVGSWQLKELLSKWKMSLALAVRSLKQLELGKTYHLL